jgi:hypothetical protein
MRTLKCDRIACEWEQERRSNRHFSQRFRFLPADDVASDSIVVLCFQSFRGYQSMKTITKLLLAGTALAAGSAANAQPITNLNDLVLFVTDTANGAQFIQDLGDTVDSLGVTQASVAADAALGGANDFAFDYSGAVGGGLSNPVGTNGVDAALASFLTANAGGTFKYGIIGAAPVGAGGVTVSGGVRVVGSFTGNAVGGTGNIGGLYGNEPSSSNVGTIQTTINGFFQSVNLGTNTPYASTSGNGFNAASFVGYGNSAALGTSVTLYELASFNDTTSGDEDANFYASSAAITVSTAGVISGLSSGSSPPPVPLPAAVWLLGSGMLGLFGIGRRRSAA